MLAAAEYVLVSGAIGADRSKRHITVVPGAGIILLVAVTIVNRVQKGLAELGH